MELTNLASPMSPDKKNNLKRPAGANSSNKVSTFVIGSRSPSPDGDQTTMINPKPNQVGKYLSKEVKEKLKNDFYVKQVSNVVLYGIPIVSLYIEHQERLCLAQISNTLLKQFSYNEIHNRRVALGITCVQCTPVQLEILRRAGAMPVSSRRCGMITRREAERLCKSFLGDNSPPRLPDDFSFAVFHECAWGCRGNFLPSRYNSSRAKCIKCAYCGIFFSPNKFIFHSHRLSPNDKYVQPDAANFNSWRRHMKLTGTPPDNVTHAWEDVKAMFNGGTRKRILSHASMSSHGSATKDRSKADPIESLPTAPKRSKDTKSNSTPTNTSQYPLRPIHHHNSAPSAPNNGNPVASVSSVVPLNTSPIRASSSFPQELPFSLSRSFMIDYMWHHQQQTHHSSVTPTSANKVNHFQFPPYSALNWIKQQPTSFLFKPNNAPTTTIAQPPALPLSASSNDEKPPAFNHFHSAAFKPVINAMRLNDESIINASSMVTSVNARNHSPASSNSSNYNHTTASSTNLSDDEQAAGGEKKFMNRKRLSKNGKEETAGDFYESNHEEERKVYLTNGNGGDSYNLENPSISDDEESEMVDIETTEDDIQIHNLQPYRTSQFETEDEEEIEVTDGKLESNNNNLASYESQFGERKGKSPIRFLKEIVNRSEREIEESYLMKKSSAQNNPPQGSLNLKKEPGRHESSSTFNYVHKIHAATNKPSDGSAPTKLWSVARLSLECNNNNNQSSSFDERNSFYQHLSQMQNKNFQHQDASASII